jgi:ubiquinone biosynthesis protein
MTISGSLESRLAKLEPSEAKAAQFMTFYAELIPHRSALMSLRDWSPELPWNAVREILRQDLSAAPEVLFSWIDRRPFRSAYFAQYHRAKTRNNQALVVKIVRSRVSQHAPDEVTEATFAGLLKTFEVDASLTAQQIFADWREYAVQAADCEAEMRGLIRLHRLNSVIRALRFPQPYSELCGPRVLAVEDLRGVPLLDLPAGNALCAEGLCQALVEQLLESPVVNLNVHPDNLMWIDGSSVGFFDVDRLLAVEASLRQYIAAMSRALSAGDAEQVHRLVSDLPVQADVGGFRIWAAAEFERWLQADTTNRAPLTTFLASLLEGARRQRVALNPGLASIARMLLSGMEAATRIDADVDASAAFRKAATRWQVRSAVDSLRPEKLIAQADDWLWLLREGPQFVRRVLEDVTEERFHLSVATRESPDDRLAANRRVKLQALAVVTLSLTILFAAATGITGISRSILDAIFLGALSITSLGIVRLWKSL